MRNLLRCSTVVAVLDESPSGPNLEVHAPVVRTRGLRIRFAGGIPSIRGYASDGDSPIDRNARLIERVRAVLALSPIKLPH
jgi:hypothetical protein